MLHQCGIHLKTSRCTGLVLLRHSFQPKCLFHKYQFQWLIVDVDPVLGKSSWMVTSLLHPMSLLQVYLTCTVILCEEGNPNSRCGQGCLNTASRRRRRDLPNGETDRHYITQGPFRVVREAQPSADQKTGAGEKTRGGNYPALRDGSKCTELVPGRKWGGLCFSNFSQGEGF